MRSPYFAFQQKNKLTFILFLIISTLLFQHKLSAQWTNGQPANRILGQGSFGPTGTGNAANQMDDPRGIFLDHTGTLWVAEEGNNRILRFDNAASKPNGSNADGVLGQAGFGTSGSGNAANQMDNPRGVFVDKNGTLWVAEKDNNRILRFDNAASKPNGANADGVLGQASFGVSTFGNGSNKMSDPTCLYVEDNGRLWVADRANNRVLRFDNAAAKANGANADGVLGQIGYGVNTSGTGAHQLNQPDGLVVSSSGTLWVGDVSNDRVLRYDNASAKANGANADGVLGQAGFGLSSGGSAANQLNNPRGLVLDGNGNLYVAETINDRITIFLDAANKGNGANADFVLGQTGFGTTGTGSTASQLNTGSTTCLTIDKTNFLLWISDTNNNRVISYQGRNNPDKQLEVPTLTTWSLLIFGLLILNIGLIFIWRFERI